MIRVQLDVHALANVHTCYDVWVPGGRVARIVQRADLWGWTQPFETWTESTETFVDSTDVNCFEFVIDDQKFGQRGGEGELCLYNRTHEKRTVRGIPNVVVSKPTTAVRMKFATPSTTIAFGVYKYEELRRAKHDPTPVWQWVGAALVPWAWFESNAFLAVNFFMWSDVRMNAVDPNSESDALIVMVGRNVKIRPNGAALGLLENDVRSVTVEYVRPETAALQNCRVIGDSIADDTKCITESYPLEGMQHPFVDAPETYGASMQSWYYWDAPVVKESWILARLRECWGLHDYDEKSYVKDVQELIAGKWVDGKSQRILTDIVRLVTMHSTSRPYLADERLVNRSEVLRGGTPRYENSDTFTSGLTAPGDCEDGAHSAFMIYQSLLLCKTWISPLVKAARSCAAILGFPICVTGTSANPFRNVEAGAHAYGAVIPMPVFVRAMFGAERLPAAMKCFHKTFGFEYPIDMVLDVLAIETTLFTTPLYNHHYDTDETRLHVVQEFATREMGETKTRAPRNFFYTFVLGDLSACHRYAVKGYTDVHRHVFYSDPDWTARPKTLDGMDASEWSCTFTFSRPGNDPRSIGITREELFTCDPVDFSLRVPVSMSKDVYSADLRLILNCRRPYVPLIDVGHADVFKDADDGAHSREAWGFYGDFIGPPPHVTVFVYTLQDERDGKSVLKKMDELRKELGAARFTLRKYANSTAIVFSDFTT